MGVEQVPIDIAGQLAEGGGASLGGAAAGPLGFFASLFGQSLFDNLFGGGGDGYSYTGDSYPNLPDYGNNNQMPVPNEFAKQAPQGFQFNMPDFGSLNRGLQGLFGNNNQYRGVMKAGQISDPQVLGSQGFDSYGLINQRGGPQYGTATPDFSGNTGPGYIHSRSGTSFDPTSYFSDKSLFPNSLVGRGGGVIWQPNASSSLESALSNSFQQQLAAFNQKIQQQQAPPQVPPPVAPQPAVNPPAPQATPESLTPPQNIQGPQTQQQQQPMPPMQLPTASPAPAPMAPQAPMPAPLPQPHPMSQMFSQPPSIEPAPQTAVGAQINVPQDIKSEMKVPEQQQQQSAPPMMSPLSSMFNQPPADNKQQDNTPQAPNLGSLFSGNQGLGQGIGQSSPSIGSADPSGQFKLPRLPDQQQQQPPLNFSFPNSGSFGQGFGQSGVQAPSGAGYGGPLMSSIQPGLSSSSTNVFNQQSGQQPQGQQGQGQQPQGQQQQSFNSQGGAFDNLWQNFLRF